MVLSNFSKILIRMQLAGQWNCHAMLYTDDQFLEGVNVILCIIFTKCMFGRLARHAFKMSSYDILSSRFEFLSLLRLLERVNIYQMKSGCPVEVKQRCHIRLLGSTNLG